MLNTSGLGYVTRKERSWLKKYLQDHNPDFAALKNDAKQRIVNELMIAHSRDWIFVPWKVFVVFFLAFSILSFLVFFHYLGVAIIIFALCIVYVLIWVKKLHTIATSDQAKLLISKK